MFHYRTLGWVPSNSLTCWVSISNTYPWSFLIAPMTPRTNGHPGPRLSPWLCRICNTHSNCLSRISGWLILDISFNGFNRSSCSLWKGTRSWLGKESKALLQLCPTALYLLAISSLSCPVGLRSLVPQRPKCWDHKVHHLSLLFLLRVQLASIHNTVGNKVPYKKNTDFDFSSSNL